MVQKFLVKKNSQIDFLSKKNLVQKIVGSKKLRSKKCGPKMFGPKKILTKDFGPKEIGSRKNCVKKLLIHLLSLKPFESEVRNQSPPLPEE